MTDQEAYRLVADAIMLLRDAYHWGEITIEVKEGIVRRVNLTTNMRPAQQAEGRGQKAEE